jgi:hypothetical protein
VAPQDAQGALTSDAPQSAQKRPLASCPHFGHLLAAGAGFPDGTVMAES